jgi:hypothetical protein
MTDRQLRRHAITEQFLTALEDVVWRYRAFSSQEELTDLCAEAVAAEVAHQLALTLGALHRHPPLTPRATDQAATSPNTPLVETLASGRPIL